MPGAMDGRIALVTGASRGIGRAAAVALAEAGAHVIAIARTVGGLEELDDDIKAKSGSPATLVPLDITNGDGIDRLGAEIHQRWGKLDALLGNAGTLGVLTPLAHLDVAVWDKTLDVNLTANWRLIRSMDPLLRQSDAGRAVFVTSGAARNCRPFWGPYSISKAGLEAMVRTYAGEMQSTEVRANLFDPGPTRTAMRAEAMPGEDPMTLKTPESIAGKIVEMLSPNFDRNGVLYLAKTGEFHSFG
jgi:NAD(P)-dependent dehydrogenase (short-subunit alcohol dehydrogenase family)